MPIVLGQHDGNDRRRSTIEPKLHRTLDVTDSRIQKLRFKNCDARPMKEDIELSVGRDGQVTVWNNVGTPGTADHDPSLRSVLLRPS